MYIEGPIRNYLDDLAAKKPAPGGGSAAALSAAIGVGLISMVANYTAGHPRYKDVEKKVADILAKADELRDELQGLVDKDVEAYNKLSRAMKECAKGSPELDRIYKEALTPPLRVCEIASECLRICARLVECGNKNLVTDIAIAAILLEGAFFSAKFNVYINLKCIKDMGYIGLIHKRLQPLEDEMPALKENILEKCEDIIQK